MSSETAQTVTRIAPPVWTMGDRIRKARQTAGLTMEELGKVVGVSRATISSWEMGDTAPRRSSLFMIALRCSAPLWWLADEEPGSDGVPDAVYYVNSHGDAEQLSTIWYLYHADAASVA